MGESFELMTVDEVAHYLRMPVSTIRAKVRKKAIPFTRIGRKILFPRAGLRLWIVQCTAGPAEIVRLWKSMELQGISEELPKASLTPREKDQIRRSRKAILSGNLVPLEF